MKNAAKDMQKIYAQTATVDLIKNRNKKTRELQRVRYERGYWARKECARLEYLRDQIDDEIRRRAGIDFH